MKRVLFVSPCNGIGAHEEKFLVALSRAGYVTRVFAYHPVRMSPHLEAIPNVSIDFVHLRVAGRIQRGVSMHLLPRFRRCIEEFRPDVIHAGNSWNDSFLAALSGFHPLLAMPYGSDVLIDPVRSRFFDWCNRRTFRSADWVTVDSERVKDTIVARYRYPAERITVIPWGIEVEAISKLRHPWREVLRERLGWNTNVVLMMNRHHEAVYGIDVFLQAMKLVLDADKRVRVLFVGGGSLTPQYREFIVSHGLNDFFFMPGKIPRNELYQYLHAADLYVSSSHSDGTSVSLLEAMAARLGVIVTDVPSILEWVTPGVNGDVVGRNDPAGLASAIVAAVADPAMFRRWGDWNLALVRERADWRSNFREFQNIYDNLVKASR